MPEKMTTTAIILAAGSGKRMNSNVAKQYMLLAGKPVLYYSLKVFQESCIDHIILVVGENDLEYVKRDVVDKYGFDKVRHVIAGGSERYFSVYHGLQAAAAYSSGESYIFIHDGARPFVSEQMIEEALVCVQTEKACVIGMPVKDTIKIADVSDYAVETPKRSQVWMIQTPQVFEFSLVKKAYDTFIHKADDVLQRGVQITDDASVIELFTQQKVKLLKGTYTNIKITTPEDLDAAELFLKRVKSGS